MLITKGNPIRQNEYIAGGLIREGDCVVLDSSGRVVAASSTPAALCGVANSYAAQAGDTVLVWDHPDQLFIADVDDNSIDALTDFNLNYQIVFGSPGTSRISGHAIDGDSGDSTATLPLKVLRPSYEAGNSLGAGARVICKINNHQLSGGTGTVGV